MAYTRNPRKRIVRGSSVDELRQAGRRPSEELRESDVDMPFVNLASSSIGTAQDVVQRIGNAIIGGDFGGNARGSGAIDIQIERSADTDVASGVWAVAFGRHVEASGVDSIAIGARVKATGAGAVALGNAEAHGNSSLAVGPGALVSAGASFGIAIGDQSWVSMRGGIAIGQIVEATGQSALAIGDNEVRAIGDRSIALGSEARAAAIESISLGHVAGYAYDAGGDHIANGLRSISIGKNAYAGSADEAVIAATAIKMQTSRVGGYPSTFTYESVITTSEASPVTGNLAKFLDVDRVGDAGVAAADLGSMGRTWMGF